MSEDTTSHTESFEVTGDDLVARVKELVHEGNVRRVIIKNEEGDRVLEIPLTIGVVGALFLPTLAALGAVAALLDKCTIEVEREKPTESHGTDTP